MNIATRSWKLGRLWGRCILIHGMAYLHRKAARFDVTVLGDAHLTDMADRPFVLVSNHNLPGKSDLWPLAYLHYFRQYHHSTDSFIYHRILREGAGLTLNTVSICGAAWWSPRPWRLWIQRHIGQPFARGQMEMMPGLIGVEKAPGSSQRAFLDAVAEAVRRGEPILIFPGNVARPGPASNLSSGAAHIARKHDLAILPACIIGSESWKAGNRVTVAFGEAFDPAGLSKDRINAQILGRIQALLAAHADPRLEPAWEAAPRSV